MTRLLLDNGAGIHVRNEHGIGAIHYAAQTRDPVVIQHIFETGGDSTALDGHGWTTIHQFVYYYDDNFLLDDEGSPLPGYAIKDGREILHRACGTEYLSRLSTNRNLDGQKARGPINYLRRPSSDPEERVVASPKAILQHLAAASGGLPGRQLVLCRPARSPRRPRQRHTGASTTRSGPRGWSV
ncbi:uncharacterized protein PG986_003641 [Apiospora aurea]|uniref:Ankyrin repeat protein n=1 Tax=Apiospora aurea TaxID=335848 RepID=A0ABR1QTU1_9PEZI